MGDLDIRHHDKPALRSKRPVGGACGVEVWLERRIDRRLSQLEPLDSGRRATGRIRGGTTGLG